MTAEGRTQRAIQITRKVLMTIMNEPVALMRMVVYGVPPDEVEDTVADILKYLAKTSPEANKKEEG